MDLQQQAVQLAHASIAFAIEHPEIAINWHKESKYLILLSVSDLEHLENLIPKIQELSVQFSKFYEPDIDNQLTAISIAPDIRVSKLCSSYPLALKEYNNKQQNNGNKTN